MLSCYGGMNEQTVNLVVNKDGSKLTEAVSTRQLTVQSIEGITSVQLPVVAPVLQATEAAAIIHFDHSYNSTMDKSRQSQQNVSYFDNDL